MAISELIALATAMPALPIFDTYLRATGRRGQTFYFLAWLKSFAKAGGQLRDQSPS
jgi:hypothetical protein